MLKFFKVLMGMLKSQLLFLPIDKKIINIEGHCVYSNSTVIIKYNTYSKAIFYIILIMVFVSKKLKKKKSNDVMHNYYIKNYIFSKKKKNI